MVQYDEAGLNAPQIVDTVLKALRHNSAGVEEAGLGLSMITEAVGAISGAKVALELAKGISSLKSETDKNQAIIDIQRVLLEIQEAALNDKQRISDLQDKNADLQKSIAREDDWQKIKARYRLTESSGGAFTYNLIDGLEGGEAPHRLCVTCFEDRVKSVLHVTAKAEGVR